MKNDLYLKRCFDLARLGNTQTSPNPSVGSVITFENRIIGEGWHQEYGKAHAEVNAVANVNDNDKNLLKDSTIFVSLEPCFHFGKTPPCVNLILDNKIPNTVIAFTDPNPKVATQSINKLRKNDVIVTQISNSPDKFTSERDNTLSPFFTNINKSRPYIVLKWAESADGYVGVKNQKIAISNTFSQRLVHKWRSESDGILVGTETAWVDNPSLDNRYYYGKSPLRIIIDKAQKLPKHLNIFTDKQPTLIYTEGVSQKVSECIEYMHLDFESNILPSLLQDLMHRKINKLFVEGGTYTLQQFIDNGLWDEIRILKNPYLSLNTVSQAIPAPQLKNAQLNNLYSLDRNEIKIYKNA